MRVLIIRPGDTINLGRQGENDVQQVQFDVTGWAETYGSGTYSLRLLRPGESVPYEAIVTPAGELVLWNVTDTDTALSGMGEAQLVLTVGSAVAKTQIYHTMITPSIGADPEPPSQEQAWFDQLKGFADSAEESATAAGTSASDAEASAQAAAASEGRAARSASAAEVSASEAAQAAQDVQLYKGAPLTAATAAAMTDHSRTYVYVGSEAGYTYGNWYYWNGSDWASGGVYNASAIQTDKTLSVADAAADAKITGEVVNNFALGAQGTVLGALYKESGHYYAGGIYKNKKTSSTGATEDANGHATTRILNGNSYPLDAVSINSASYCFRMSGYSSTTIGSASYLGQTDYISGMTGKVLYRPKNWPYCTLEVARVPLTDTTSITDEEVAALADLITRYVDNGLASQVETNKEMIDDRTTFAVDPTTLLYGFGGVSSNGKSNSSKTRLRYRDSDGSGAIKVLAGSTVTPASGYQFDIGLYASYVSNSNFELLSYSSGKTSAMTIPYDCYVRIAFGTTGNVNLWQEDAEGNKTLTQAGETAKESALTLALIGGTVKSVLENVEMQLETQQNKVYKIGSIPLNAVAYHELWDGWVSDGKVTRELLCSVDADEDLPIYLYTLRSDMDHIATGYNLVQWNGSNELYQRQKIFITGCLHGNERTAPSAIWELVNTLFSEDRFQRVKNAFDWYFIPLVNPWGYSHTAIYGGEVHNGSAIPNWAAATFLENGTEYNGSVVHQGVRRNAHNVDINRDFASFESEEARVVRDAVQRLTADGRPFALSMDAHQAATGSNINVIGAFLALSYNAAQTDKDRIYGKWMQAGAQTEKDIAEFADVEEKQSVYPWDGSALETLRNYMEAFATYATCFEGGQTCIYYSGSDEWSNPTARALFCTQLHNFITAVTEIWM